jgi:hypothetical protein
MLEGVWLKMSKEEVLFAVFEVFPTVRTQPLISKFWTSNFFAFRPYLDLNCRQGLKQQQMWKNFHAGILLCVLFVMFFLHGSEAASCRAALSHTGGNDRAGNRQSAGFQFQYTSQPQAQIGKHVRLPFFLSFF